MPLHVLFPILLEMHGECFTVFTSVHGIVMCDRMYFEISLTHEPSVAALGHAFVTFYGTMYYFVLI